MKRLSVALTVCLLGSGLRAGTLPYEVVALDEEKQVLIRVDMDTGVQRYYPIDIDGLTNRLETVAVRDEYVYLQDWSP